MEWRLVAEGEAVRRSDQWQWERSRLRGVEVEVQSRVAAA